MGTLANGIKDIFSTSQTTATHLPVCASDGTPQGRISVGDLASVLGGIHKPLDYSTEPNLNNYVTDGIYTTTSFTASQFENAPSGISNSNEGILRVTRIVTNNTLIWQELWVNSDKKLFVRNKRNTWTAWQEVSTDIPSFYKNYNDLSSLALALGVGSLVTNYADFYKNTDDLNDVTRFTKFPCLYTSRVKPETTNGPGVEGFLLGFAVNSTGMGFQLVFSYWYSNAIYFRSHAASSTWNDWKVLNTEAIS